MSVGEPERDHSFVKSFQKGTNPIYQTLMWHTFSSDCVFVIVYLSKQSSSIISIKVSLEQGRLLVI